MQITLGNECVMDIPKWDFNWQQPYWLETPLQVGGAQEIKVTCTWDNPGTSNVTSGEATTDEMCVAFFYVTL
jgi:hypothetical protein